MIRRNARLFSLIFLFVAGCLRARPNEENNEKTTTKSRTKEQPSFIGQIAETSSRDLDKHVLLFGLFLSQHRLK